MVKACPWLDLHPIFSLDQEFVRMHSQCVGSTVNHSATKHNSPILQKPQTVSHSLLTHSCIHSEQDITPVMVLLTNPNFQIKSYLNHTIRRN